MGAEKVLQLIADEVERLHKEFCPEVEEQSFGNIIWRTTPANCRKAIYGKIVEDYEVKTVILP